MRAIIAVDLYCGAGGLTNGLEAAGIKVTTGVDKDGRNQYAYTHNNRARFLKMNIDDLARLRNHFSIFDGPPRKNQVSLLAGCPPCQPFSKLYQAKTPDDGDHLKPFRQFVNALQPDLIALENVSGLKNHESYIRLIAELANNGYYYTSQVINCQDYGIPQTRKRLVLVASKFQHIALLPPGQATKLKTVRDTIGHLPALTAGAIDGADPLHRCAGLSAINLARMKQSLPGGTWEDWEDDLMLDCHRAATGKSYKSFWGRMSFDAPAPTITTQFYGFGNGRFGHPEQHRAISLREGALLQTFPSNYKFVQPDYPIDRRITGRMIGNAVPPKLGQVIGETFMQHITSVEMRSRQGK